MWFTRIPAPLDGHREQEQCFSKAVVPATTMAHSERAAQRGGASRVAGGGGTAGGSQHVSATHTASGKGLLTQRFPSTILLGVGLLMLCQHRANPPAMPLTTHT